MMDLKAIPEIHGYLQTASGSADPEECACAENFLLDERPAPSAVDLYRPHLTAGPVSDLDDWYGRHRGFATAQLFIDPDEAQVPITFRVLNARNRVSQIDQRLNLIRDDWAVQLRDRLGLGHFDPGRAGRPVEIFLMRYTVAEVVAALGGQGHPAIPTVLDGDLNPFFFPSPLPAADATEAPLYGRTVNLTPVDAENDYLMGCELLHPRITYRPEHFYRAGVIAEPVAMPLTRARGFHLPWARLYAERDDFGAGVLGAGTR